MGRRSDPPPETLLLARSQLRAGTAPGVYEMISAGRDIAPASFRLISSFPIDSGEFAQARRRLMNHTVWRLSAEDLPLQSIRMTDCPP